MTAPRSSRIPSRSIALLALLSILVADGIAQTTPATLHPQALTGAARAFRSQILCNACKGDGVIEKNVTRRDKDKDENWVLDTNIERQACKHCEGDGEYIGRNVMATGERFVQTLATIDLTHANATNRLDAARDMLQTIECALWRSETSYFNDTSLRELSKPNPTIGSVILINGVYENSTIRNNAAGGRHLVRVAGSNFLFQYDQIRIHDASHEKPVFAGGILDRFEVTGPLPGYPNGRRVAVIRDGFVVRTAPGCSK